MNYTRRARLVWSRTLSRGVLVTAPVSRSKSSCTSSLSVSSTPKAEISALFSFSQGGLHWNETTRMAWWVAKASCPA